MSDNDNVTTPSDNNQSGENPAQQDAPAPRARRNVRRTPRKSADDQSLIAYAPQADSVRKTPRRRTPPPVVEAPVEQVEAPQPKASVVLADEASEIHTISVPRRAPALEDVPTRFSSDEDEAQPPAKEPAREEAPSPGSIAMERRRERRMARLSEQPPADDREQPAERRDYDRENERDDSAQEDRGDDRDNSREDTYDNHDDDRDDRNDREEREEQDSSDDDGEEPSQREEDEGAQREEGSERGQGQERQDRRQDGGQQRRDQGYGQGGQQQGGYNDRRLSKKQKFKLKKQQQQQRFQQGGGQQRSFQQPQQLQQGDRPAPQQQHPHQPQQHQKRNRSDYYGREDSIFLEIGDLPELEALRDPEVMEKLAAEHQEGGEAVDLCELLTANIHLLIGRAKSEFALTVDGMPLRAQLVEQILHAAWEAKRRIVVEGVVETTPDGHGLLVYQHENYRVRPLCAFIPRVLMRRHALKRGHIVKAVLQPPRKELTLDGAKENCPAALQVLSIMGRDPAENLKTTPFEDLTPYYPTERFILETSPDVKWDNVSMRVVDLLTPVGKGQRGLIVAPPRTGKTILQQGIANAIMTNNPESHLIVLLVDERPEEVTDFRRQIASKGEVIASTFDEVAESHVHAAEMVIEKARRMVEVGRHVVILLDSITRLARAYNALAGNSGKILSGGVEATAMQKPKRFFGSARNIEGGGSLTILGTALVETGSRMDEVIFEEFKGTGNMELSLDRALVDKRIFPAINLEKSGTRKEELLYHPDEMIKVYGLRRAMKGVPSPDAMEMLITRVKKTAQTSSS
jgi:transcription termination factor Rho